MAAAPGSKPSTPPECGFTKQELFERLEKARTAAPDLFADFFFKTKEEAPERFKHLADGVLVRCLECGRTMGAHVESATLTAEALAVVQSVARAEAQKVRDEALSTPGSRTVRTVATSRSGASAESPAPGSVGPTSVNSTPSTRREAPGTPPDREGAPSRDDDDA